MQINNKKLVPLIIPSYEPDERLLELLKDIRNMCENPVILVNDGSSSLFNHFFETAVQEYGVILLSHPQNMGKGRALKTAFTYCLSNYPSALGVITLDSDGQHTIEDIKKIEKNSEIIVGH